MVQKIHIIYYWLMHVVICAEWDFNFEKFVQEIFDKNEYTFGFEMVYRNEYEL